MCRLCWLAGFVARCVAKFINGRYHTTLVEAALAISSEAVVVLALDASSAPRAICYRLALGDVACDSSVATSSAIVMF